MKRTKEVKREIEEMDNLDVYYEDLGREWTNAQQEVNDKALGI